MGMLRVKATTAVAGMWAGEEYDVPDTDFVQLLLAISHLVLVKDYDAEAETLPDLPEPAVPTHPEAMLLPNAPVVVVVAEGGAAGTGDNPGEPGGASSVTVVDG